MLAEQSVDVIDVRDITTLGRQRLAGLPECLDEQRRIDRRIHHVGPRILPRETLVGACVEHPTGRISELPLELLEDLFGVGLSGDADGQCIKRLDRLGIKLAG